ncbi:hypothetical protein MHLP_01875 [Candidatus Mycoplasma haematolamae str. Purdue]|uniref:Uncharacterized protein n=1 Tax=Mycoplasma haematolamae (strain Purdue) TaxID=1212765 RepID=I7B9M9_MYCHA|nr:hypothetical protein [Candidatus Mycoplasma haematolamae]AFO51955.1 hypothetical protein MHLP_01875 [Candidatus Mycoplasma haematolamae str. Purdue]
MNVFFKVIVPLLAVGGGGYAAITPAVPLIRERQETFKLVDSEGFPRDTKNLTCTFVRWADSSLIFDSKDGKIYCGPKNGLEDINPELRESRKRQLHKGLYCRKEKGETLCYANKFERKRDKEIILFV